MKLAEIIKTERMKEIIGKIRKTVAIVTVASFVVASFAPCAFSATEYNANPGNKLDLSQGIAFCVTSSSSLTEYTAPSDGWVIMSVQGRYYGSDDGYDAGSMTVTYSDGSSRTFTSPSSSNVKGSENYVTLYVDKGTKLTSVSGTVQGVFVNSSAGSDKDLLVNGTTELNGATTVKSDLGVSGNSSVSGSSTVGQNLNVSGGLAVCGSSTFAGKVTVNNDLAVSGDISGNSVTVAGTKYISSTGLNAGSKRITNVANGTAATDAATYGQTAGSMTYSSSSSVLTLKDRNGNTIDTVTITGGGSSNTSTNAVEYDDDTKTSVTLGKNTTAVKVTNVAAGATTATSTDAVNGSQLYTALQDIAQNTTDIATINSSDVMTSGITAAKVATYDNYDSRITANATNITTATTAIANKADKTDTVTNIAVDASGKLTQTKGDGTTSDIAQLSGQNVTSANLSAKQLVISTKDAYSGAVNTVTADLSSLETGTKVITDDVTFEGDGKNIDIQTTGTTTKTSKITLSDNITDISSITTQASASGAKTTLSSSGLSVADGNTAVTESAVKIGNSSITTDSLTVNGTEYISASGINAGANKITNVAAGDTTAGSTDAVNGGQLYNASSVTVNGTNINDGNGIELIAGDNVSITSSGNSVTISASGTGSDINAVKYDYNATTKTGNNSVTFYDKNGQTEDTGGERVTLKNVAIEASAIGTNNNVSGTDALAFGYGNNASGTQSIAIGYGNSVTGNNSGALGDPNIISGNSSYAVGNNNTITGNNTVVLGNGVTASYDNSVVLGNNSTLSQAHTVTSTAGSATAGTTGVVSVGAKGAERQIQNVAAGEISATSTDAVNGSQLYNAIQNSGSVALDQVKTEIKEIGAISAALSGLHYAEPTGEENDKISAAVSYGGYRGESAAAVGIAYKPNSNFMLSASTSVGNSQNAYNAGISYKFGNGNTKQSKTAQQARQIQALTQKVQMLEQILTRQYRQQQVVSRQGENEGITRTITEPNTRTNTEETVHKERQGITVEPETIEDIAGM